MKVVKLRRNPRDEYTIMVPKEIGTELRERRLEYFTFGVTEYGTLQYTPINTEAT